jgi:hypothetical protein
MSSTRGCKRCGGPGAVGRARTMYLGNEPFRDSSWLCHGCFVEAENENVRAQWRTSQGWADEVDLRDLFFD